MVLKCLSWRGLSLGKHERYDLEGKRNQKDTKRRSKKQNKRKTIIRDPVRKKKVRDVKYRRLRSVGNQKNKKDTKAKQRQK